MAETSTLQCDFDRVMSPAHQARFIAEVAWRDRDGMRLDDTDLRERFAPRFAQLRAMEVWGEVESVLRRYVRSAVPAPRRSERAFWSCACLPESDEALVLARIDVGNGEVCTVTADDSLTFSFRLGLNPLDLPRFATRPGLSVADLRTRTDGDIEVVLSAVGGDAAMGLFDDEVIVRGMRRFTLALARQGPCSSGHWHSLQLADVLLSEPELPPSPSPGDAVYRDPSVPPPPAPIDDAIAEVDRLLAASHYAEARETLVTALSLRGSELADAVDPEHGASALDRAAAALAELVGALPDDDAAVLSWVPRARLLGDAGAAVYNDLLVLAGRFHRRAERPARGIEFVARALGQLEERHPSIALLLIELARCYTALGDGDAASAHLAVALRHADAEPALSTRLAARASLAERHLRAGDLTPAARSLADALDLARVHGRASLLPHLLAPLGWCDERRGALSDAVAHYAEALALLDDDAPPGLRRGVLAGLVRCHDRRGETAAADAYLRRAEAMTESAWPGERGWPFEPLIDACLATTAPSQHHAPPA